MSRHIPNAKDLIQQIRDTAEFHLLRYLEAIERARRLELQFIPEPTYSMGPYTPAERARQYRARRRQLSTMEAAE